MQLKLSRLDRSTLPTISLQTIPPFQTTLILALAMILPAISHGQSYFKETITLLLPGLASIVGSMLMIRHFALMLKTANKGLSTTKARYTYSLLHRFFYSASFSDLPAPYAGSLLAASCPALHHLSEHFLFLKNYYANLTVQNSGLFIWNLITIGSVEMISDTSGDNTKTIFAAPNTQLQSHPYVKTLAASCGQSMLTDVSGARLHHTSLTTKQRTTMIARMMTLVLSVK
jgi:hypothetical protein